MGTSKHAVQLQILIAMITYRLLRLTQNTSPVTLSLQRLAQLLSINLFHRGPLNDLLVRLLKKRPPKALSNIIENLSFNLTGH